MTKQGEAAVVKDRDGYVLWVAEYRRDGSVAAEFRAGSGVPLTSFVVSEIIDLPRLLLHRGALFLHASYIVTEGQAILFTAKKQTGKSTQAALWRRYAGAEIINGDRAMIERRGAVYYACATPYSGSSKICQKVDAPLRAVVILSQGDRSEARPAAPGEALRALLTGCTVDKSAASQVELLLGAAERLAASVPFYALRCLPDESAVSVLRDAIKK